MLILLAVVATAAFIFFGVRGTELLTEILAAMKLRNSQGERLMNTLADLQSTAAQTVALSQQVLTTFQGLAGGDAATIASLNAQLATANASAAATASAIDTLTTQLATANVNTSAALASVTAPASPAPAATPAA